MVNDIKFRPTKSRQRQTIETNKCHKSTTFVPDTYILPEGYHPTLQTNFSTEAQQNFQNYAKCAT